MSLKKLLRAKKYQRGVSMVEYTLLLSFIAIVAIVNLAGTGNRSMASLNRVSDVIHQASTGFNGWSDGGGDLTPPP